jgi:hypothetical protein
MSESFWGEIPEAASVSTPYSILVEQGKMLESATNNRLGCFALKTMAGSKFLVDFYIRAPSLNDYKYNLFRIVYDVTLYPLSIIKDGNYLMDLATEQDFKDYLRTLLSSDTTMKVVQALLAQIRDDVELPPF